MNPAPHLGQQERCLMNIYGGIWEVLGNRPSRGQSPEQLGIVWVLK